MNTSMPNPENNFFLLQIYSEIRGRMHPTAKLKCILFHSISKKGSIQ